MARPAIHYIIVRSRELGGEVIAERLLVNGKFSTDGEAKQFTNRAGATLYAKNRCIKSYSVVPVAKELSKEELWKHIARERRGE